MSTAKSLPTSPAIKTELTTEEKLAALEERFAALAKQHEELYEKSFGRANGTGTDGINPLWPRPEGSVAAINGDEDKPASDQEVSSDSRARILINIRNPKTGERKDLPLTTYTAPAKKEEPATTYAFTLRKTIKTAPTEDDSSEIDIADPNLWDILKKTLRDYPYHLFQGKPATLSSPFEPIVLHWERLKRVLKDESLNQQTRDDLELLMKTISGDSGDPKLEKYFKTRESSINQKIVSFESLWTIFPPGTLIYGKAFQGQDQVFVVQGNSFAWPSAGRGSRDGSKWVLYCWTYDWNGKKFQRLSLRIVFEKFSGQKPISTLPFYPFELHEDREEVEKKLKIRGKRFRDICEAPKGNRMFKYEGKAIFGKQGFSGITGDDEKDDVSSRMDFLDRFFGRPSLSDRLPSMAIVKTSSVSSTVMVDFESYFQYGPATAQVGSLFPNQSLSECECQDCKDNEGLTRNHRTRFDNQDTNWEDEQYILCPPRVLGYILRDKQWGQLDVDTLDQIPPTDLEDAFNKKLHLQGKAGEKTKRMLMHLVKTHGESAMSAEDNDHYRMNDIVADKGKGLVILLYGPPGVGKTSTAETVAIAARKPLFSVSVADVGTKAKNVESNLAKIFDLATTWEAVLLIDEADVFLESRGRGVGTSTEKNALVSVFLRVLEYYQGILILTTNQIAHFDVAIRSRIHIAIKYNALDYDQTMAIFQQFIKQLREKELIRDGDINDITEWLEDEATKKGFDGRQIRNIMSSAVSLARAEKKPYITKRDIKDIAEITKDFKDDYSLQYNQYMIEQNKGKEK